MYVPFQLETQYIPSTSSAVTLPSHGDRVKLESNGSRYGLRIDGLTQREEAADWMPRVFTGLTNLMLEMKSSFTASWELAPTTAIVKPLPPSASVLSSFDALCDQDRPFVVESGQRMGVWDGHAPTINVGFSLQRAADAIAEGMLVHNADQLFGDQRFRTAVELFASVAFEQSINARLLISAMALEVLAPATEKHPVALGVIQRWAVEMDTLLTETRLQSDEYHALESLKKELLVRKIASIRSRIKSLVTVTLDDLPNVKELAKRAVKGYDERSLLVHEGALPGNRSEVAAESLRQITELIISRRLYKENVGLL